MLRINFSALCALSFPFSLPVEFQKLGVRCLYDNASVASVAKVLFLCCLPSQLPNICLKIQNKLEKTCIVYSFVSAIPLPR